MLNSHVRILGEAGQAYSLDEALAMVGFGKYQALLLAYGGLAYTADAMEIMILSFIGAAVESEWHLSPGEKSFISTVVFAGMLVGSYLWGVISDVYGRKKGILGLAAITSVAGILSAFSPNYTLLLLLRFIAGVGLGGKHTFITWFLEFIPVQNRGFWMIVFSSFWTMGTILESALAWIVMPNFGWRWLLAISSGPCFIVLLLYGLIPESPRFLCMKGRFKEARYILERAADFNGTSLKNGILVLDHIKDDNESSSLENASLLLPSMDEADSPSGSSSSLSTLFSPKLLRTTLVLWVLYFGNTFSYYGVILLASELSGGGSKCTKNTLHSDQSQSGSLYLDAFISSLAEVPGLIVAALVLDSVGRKLSMIAMFVLASVLLIPLLTHQNEAITTSLLFGSRALVSATFIVACIYAPEVYPTSIRGTGVGVTTAIGRIGGMLCPLVAVALVDNCEQTFAVILFQITILGCALSVFVSPFETKGRNLADVVE